MANETTASLLEEIVPTEDIPAFIASFERAARVGRAIAWQRPAPLGSVAQRWPRFNDLSSVPAGTKTEGASFTRVTIDSTESSTTPGIVGFEMALTDEVMQATTLGAGVQALVIIEALGALENRMDTDALSGSTSATNTIGSTTDNFTADKFNAAAAQYRTLNLQAVAPMGHAFVGHGDAFRDLTSSWLNGSAPFAANQALAEAFGPAAGFHGTYLGFAMFSSNNVAAESPGWSNFMTPVGAGACGIGISMTEDPRIEINRGSVGALDAETMMVFRAWYGAGLVNPRRFLEVLSRT